eukprot:gnl/MRDRNA2_/MRDRNA2_116003_c0_seq1.p1 gnl/MRDRNA2_/MRDRNA2_116003_c0~~gnl/MRDRNA2_/MRDRNA2_116003_c0_seq1.p1  ORF type:complete len:504 (-),score=101.92 gnl/MRDRNA2_/MRDRNA2_116003_c0_seq1:39-1550(-)
MAPIHNGMHPGTYTQPDGGWSGAPEAFSGQHPTTWGGPSSTTSKRSGSNSPRLPPLEPRRASAAEIASAQAHLVLLKRKMPSRRRTPREASRGRGMRDSSVGPPAVREESVTRSRPSRGHSMPPQLHDEDPEPHEERVHRRPPKQKPVVQNSPRDRDHRADHAQREDPVRKGHDSRAPQDSSASNPYPASSTGSAMQSRRQDAGAYPPRGAPPATSSGGYQGGSLPPGVSEDALAGAFPDQAELELVQCQDCGRSFTQEALKKHAKLCKKVFCTKRKKFDSAANRLGEFENAQELVANAKKIEKEVESKVKEKEKPAQASRNSSKEKESQKADEKVPAWKKKSMEFRAAMLAAKAAAGDEEAQSKAATLQSELDDIKKNEGDDAIDPDKIKCPHCGRTFNKTAGERHIAICVKMFGSKPGGGRLQKGGGVQAASNKKREAEHAPPPPDNHPRSAPLAPSSDPRVGDMRAAAARRTTSQEAGARRSLTREQRPTSRQQLPPRGR